MLTGFNAKEFIMPHLDTMLAAALAVQKKAYAPYSHFFVGCCLQSATGQLYVGCNIENVSYGLTLCAEAAAISQLIIAGEQTITQVVIVGSSEQTCTPCGACRQRLAEFASPQTHIHMGNRAGIHQTLTIDELLPYAFHAEHLPR